MESKMSRAAARPDYGYVNAERRRHPRKAVRVPAEIMIGDTVQCECTILDISLGGAQLAIPAGYVLPDQFMIIPPSRLCRVAWRKEDRIGVAFQPEEPFTGR
jgi:PilZ domain-containing protein